MRGLALFAALAIVGIAPAARAQTVAVTDGISYNVGSMVSIRVESAGAGRVGAAIRYAGEREAVVGNLSVPSNGEYAPLWRIPRDARTGRYEVDLDDVRNVTSFVVHRKLARIVNAEVDRTFYTNGDPIRCSVAIENATDVQLKGLRVEFSPFHFPWIAPAPDEPRYTPAVIDESLQLEPGESKQLPAKRVATARGGNQPAVTGYVVALWDKERRTLYDIAFTKPVFLRPPNIDYPKQYPFLYLYPTLRDVEQRAMAYRQFYPPGFVSDVVRFDTTHTIFPSAADAEFTFSIRPHAGVDVSGVKVRTRVLDSHGKLLREAYLDTAATHGKASGLADGLYTYEVAVENKSGDVVASRRMEFALNKLPKSLLIFGAHQDDDTAHPALIRAAVENHIPIHVVYLTSGDAGGCERFYMATCDASRALDFGMVRTAEARASLGHLGVPAENIFFLGLPDGGLEEIWFDHSTASNPYLSVLLATDHAPYPRLAHPNLPFAREPVVSAVKEFVRKYQPEVVVTGHPEERHVDHRANNWVVVAAMQELLREGAISRDTRVLVDKSYGETSWIHSPYTYKEHVFYVPGEVARVGQEALWLYQSQDGNHQQGAMVPYEKLLRGEAYPHLWLSDWMDHEGWNARRKNLER